MRVTLRPATAADVEAVAGDKPYHRLFALAGDVEGRTIGVGALIFRPDGVWASVVLMDEARRFKAALVRCARRLLAEADAMGVRRLLAKPEPGREGAEALLTRLGFERITLRGDAVWMRRRG